MVSTLYSSGSGSPSRRWSMSQSPSYVGRILRLRISYPSSSASLSSSSMSPGLSADVEVDTKSQGRRARWGTTQRLRQRTAALKEADRARAVRFDGVRRATAEQGPETTDPLVDIVPVVSGP